MSSRDAMMTSAGVSLRRWSATFERAQEAWLVQLIHAGLDLTRGMSPQGRGGFP